MPTQKAIKTAYENGFIASGHNVHWRDCPYKNTKAKAYRNAWVKGWVKCRMMLLDKFDEYHKFKCDSCGKHDMHPDRINDVDVFTCDYCGFTVENLELQEL